MIAPRPRRLYLSAEQVRRLRMRPDIDTERLDAMIAKDELSDGGGHWGRTARSGWKGYKDGGKVYLDWPELVRRWGPVERREHC